MTSHPLITKDKYYQSFFKTNLSMTKLFDSGFLIGILTAIVSWLASFIVPIIPFVGLTVLFVLCDLYTGKHAAKARNNVLILAKSDKALPPSKVVHSKGLRRSVEKISVYFIALLLSESMSQTFTVAEYYLPLTYAMAFAICGIEYKSNIENIQDITGNGRLWNYVKEYIIRAKK